jgi:hypothetical protein
MVVARQLSKQQVVIFISRVIHHDLTFIPLAGSIPKTVILCLSLPFSRKQARSQPNPGPLAVFCPGQLLSRSQLE